MRGGWRSRIRASGARIAVTAPVDAEFAKALALFDFDA